MGGHPVFSDTYDIQCVNSIVVHRLNVTVKLYIILYLAYRMKEFTVTVKIHVG